MRVIVIALVAFALIYVLLVVVDIRGHSGSPLTASGPPSLPGALADSWGITPPFLKVGTRDMYVNALTLSGTTLRLTPYVPATISVQAAGAWYQPARVLRLVFENASAGSVTLDYPPIAPPSESGKKPEPLSASNPTVLIVLPKSGGVVSLTCAAFTPCLLSL